MPAAVIAIDGPSGSGKGTLAESLARRLGWRLLDSGALYRIVALAAAQRDVDLDDGAALADMARDLDIEFRPGDGGVVVQLDGQDVTLQIRAESVSATASRVAALPAVRKALLERQRGLRREPGLVADGRDMGTVVFPDAQLKVFLEASPEERAARRHKQLIDKGLGGSLRALLVSIRERDARDRQRTESPLVAAQDAVIIDSTALDIDAVEQHVWELIKAKGLLGEDG
jgi:cytidylate kinase